MDVYVWSCECVVFIFNRDLVAELPFILMHPKPEEEEPNPILTDRSPGKHHSAGQRSDDANENASSQVTTGNLIQLDGLVFGSICLNCLNIIAVVLYNFTYQIIKFQWYRLQMYFYSSSFFFLSLVHTETMISRMMISYSRILLVYDSKVVKRRPKIITFDSNNCDTHHTHTHTRHFILNVYFMRE